MGVLAGTRAPVALSVRGPSGPPGCRCTSGCRCAGLLARLGVGAVPAVGARALWPAAGVAGQEYGPAEGRLLWIRACRRPERSPAFGRRRLPWGFAPGGPEGPRTGRRSVLCAPVVLTGGSETDRVLRMGVDAPSKELRVQAAVEAGAERGLVSGPTLVRSSRGTCIVDDAGVLIEGWREQADRPAIALNTPAARKSRSWEGSYLTLVGEVDISPTPKVRLTLRSVGSP